MESRLTSANTSCTLGSSRDQAITWTLLGPDFYQIHFNFLLSAAGIVQVATTTHHCMDGQIQLLPDFRGRQRQRSDSKLAAEPPHSRAMSHWDESQVFSKSDEELSSSFRKRLGCLFQHTCHKVPLRQAQLQCGHYGPSLKVAIIQGHLTKPTRFQSGVCKG